jgi:hypothetical protein
MRSPGGVRLGSSFGAESAVRRIRALASFKTPGFLDGIRAKTALPVPAASHGVDLDACGGREGVAWL